MNFTNRKTVYPQRFKMTANGEEQVVLLSRNEGEIIAEGTPLTAQSLAQALNEKQNVLTASNANGGLEIAKDENGNTVISVKNYEAKGYTHIAQRLPNSLYSMDYVNWTANPLYTNTDSGLITIPDRVYKSVDLSFSLGEVYSGEETKNMKITFTEANGAGKITTLNYDINSKIVYFSRYENGQLIQSDARSFTFNTSFRVIRMTRYSGGYVYTFFDGNTYRGSIYTQENDVSTVAFGTDACNAQLKFWKIRG